MVDVSTFPLSLQSVSFTKLIFEAILNFDQTLNTDLQLSPINNIAVDKDPRQENVMIMQMSTVINPERRNDEPYYIEAVVLAYFNYDPKLTYEEAKRGVTITGHSVCYGAIREAVGWISGRLPYGPIGLGLSILQSSPKDNEAKINPKEK